MKTLGVVIAEPAQPEHQNFQQIPQQHRDKVDDQHQKRLVFVGQQNTVAPALDALERIVPHRTGRRAADVAALGRGAVDVLVAQAVRAPAQVNILIVGKKQFVKYADFVQNRFAVERRTAAGAENAAGLGVAAGFQAVAALAGKT